MKNHFDRLSDFLARGVGYVFPPRQAVAAFYPGIVRGAIWALIATAIFATISFIGFVATGAAFGIEAMFQLVVLAISLTWADSPNFLSQTGSGLDSALFELSIRPTLLVVLIAWLAYLAGKRFANSEGASPVSSRLFAVGMGAGFAAALMALTYAASSAPISSDVLGFANLAADIRFALPDLADLTTAFLVVALPTWFGAWRQYAKTAAGQFGAQKWLAALISNFTVYYAVTVTLLVVGLTVFQLIEPDFKPAVAPADPVKLTQEMIVGIAIVILVILLFLPTLLVAFGSLIAGYSWGPSYDGQTGQLVSSSLDFVSNSLGSFGINVGNDWLLSLWSTNLIAWPAFAVSIIVVGFLAAVAGSNATVATGYRVNADFTGLKVLVKFTLIAFAIQSLTNFKFASEFNAATTASGEEPEAVRQWFVFGISNASLILVSLVIFSAATLAGRFQAELFSGAMPRLAKISMPRVATGEQTTPQRLVGVFVTTIVVASFVIPIGVATTERVLASVDSPARKGEALASAMADADVAALRDVFNSSKAKDLKWLPTQSMQVALPSADAKLEIEMTNDLGKPWEVGNTDANLKLTWTEGEDKVVYSFSLKSDIKQHLGQIDYVVYENEAAPVSLYLKVGAALKQAKMMDISVNGESVKEGQYSALPGTYLLETKGFKLVAPETLTVNTSKPTVEVTLGEKLALPAGASEKLKSAIEKESATCEKLTPKGNSDCFSRTTIAATGKLTSGDEVAQYFDVAESKYRLEGAECAAEGKDVLQTATLMTRTVECTYTVTFDRVFYDYTIRKVPTFRTEFYLYWCGWNICSGTRQVRSGQRDEKVRGEELGRGTYTSKVTVNVVATGRLDDKNVFSVTNTRAQAK